MGQQRHRPADKKRPAILFPIYNAIAASIAAGMGMMNSNYQKGNGFGAAWWSQPIPGGWSEKNRKARPCLHCGTETKHKKPFCSAEHKKLWEADNPGNGRYVHETWKEIPHEELCRILKRHTNDKLYNCEDGNYSIRYDSFATDFTLTDHSSDYAQIFDCLINAQRAAHQHMTGQDITVH